VEELVGLLKERAEHRVEQEAALVAQ
jgi:hypothetical protein